MAAAKAKVAAPRLLPGADEWLAAFFELSTDRQMGMGLGPIPAASIDRWLALEGYGDMEAAWFRRCVRAMDAEFLGTRKAPITEEGMGALLRGAAKA